MLTSCIVWTWISNDGPNNQIIICDSGLGLSNICNVVVICYSQPNIADDLDIAIDAIVSMILP